MSVSAVKEAYDSLRSEIANVVVGQDDLLRSLLVGFFSDGHVLLEGVPGLAKTLVAESLSKALDLDAVRIQFTPDLLPSDIVGTETYRPQTGEFSVKKGPVFANVVVADEINRAPSKVQSALLEAMQERRVSIAGESFPLPAPFFVVATMNPLEEEGTYALPEASLDRFLLKIRVDYPNKAEEIEIMRRMSSSKALSVGKVLGKKEVVELRKAVQDGVHVDEKLYSYVADLVSATREPAKYGMNEYAGMMAYGASPRASIGLIRAAKALAAISGRDYAVPEDVKAVAKEVLRHRIGLAYEATVTGTDPDILIEAVLAHVPVP
ncbi:MAG: MoxR-like ATPase [Patescibacteria group bacterium]|nr:MoxR-like ATPase [Patescibacteria group bacterium]